MIPYPKHHRGLPINRSDLSIPNRLVRSGLSVYFMMERRDGPSWRERRDGPFKFIINDWLFSIDSLCTGILLMPVGAMQYWPTYTYRTLFF